MLKKNMTGKKRKPESNRKSTKKLNLPKKGDIVVTPFPFSDLSENKIRPAMVLSKRPINNEIVVAFISSSIDSKNIYDVKVKKDELNKLNKDSVIRCSKISTLHKGVILGKMGRLSSGYIKKVDTKLIKMLF
jgi:mRNA interferase MazF